LRVEGKRIQVFVEDQQVVDYTEPENPQRERKRIKRLIDPNGGAIAIQAHDPNSVFYFKTIQLREIP
ncbi:MAG: family 16 glycoside hydrolase, partial [Planctomycetota bacterium]